MKKIFVLFISILFLQNCATSSQKSEQERMTSSEEMSEYQQKTEIVELNPEVFMDVENKSKLREMFNKIGSIKNNLIDRTGRAIEHVTVGVSADAFVGVGVSKMLEFAVHEKSIGVFCAPGVSARTDVGVGVDLSVGKTLACQSNEHYSGGFLGAFAGLSAEAAGLPAGASASYNIGLNYPKFKDGLNDAIESNKLSAAKLSRELGYLAEHADTAGMLFLYSIAHQVLAKRSSSSQRLSDRLNELIARLAHSNHSLSKEFLAYLNSQALSDFLDNNNFYQLRTLTNILRNSLTGCDSVGGALGLSLSVSPASVGIKYSDFKLLTEFDLEEMKDLDIISPDIFENPYDYSISHLRKAASLATKLLSIPFQLSGNKCSVFQVIKL
ncbi:hypothetical protein [Pseudobdellovibrio sp. HCB154]|uniref:hypothetical protein n=1 Tax=Pseudobdellovibrio sp. HCB154 TaxID=3386277 RepID=UPI003917196C